MTTDAAPEVELATRLVGGVWGHLVGDAMGVPYEFRSPDEIDAIRWGETGTHDQPPGTWSDDGALMLALLDSLTASGVGFEVDDQGRRALAWWRDRAYTPDGDGCFDMGDTTRRALSAIEAGQPAADAGPVDEWSCGNGSLMRILPVALVGRDLETADLIEQSQRASRVTHGHPRCQVACVLYVLTARNLLQGQRDRGAALSNAADDLRAAYGGEPEMIEALYHLLGYSERGGKGRVWDSFWSAWDALGGATSYQETIERAIAYGNDTDTTAAIAGGLAGIYWGIDGIPKEWLDGMRGREVVVPLVDGLLGRGGWKTSTARPLRVDWVPAEVVPQLGGRLGMTFLIGKQRDGWSGMHWRDLETDAKRLAGEHRADTYLLLVEDKELEAARVTRIGEVLAANGVDLVRFPIRDVNVTDDRDAVRVVLDDMLARLAAGQRVVVACRGGLGRTGTIVACLLRYIGLDADRAIAITRATRPGAIETSLQEQFVRDWTWPR
jgi:ADP-ribosylglycohydrolase/protein-tyrosine phosphatase